MEKEIKKETERVGGGDGARESRRKRESRREKEREREKGVKRKEKERKKKVKKNETKETIFSFISSLSFSSKRRRSLFQGHSGKGQMLRVLFYKAARAREREREIKEKTSPPLFLVALLIHLFLLAFFPTSSCSSTLPSLSYLLNPLPPPREVSTSVAFVFLLGTEPCEGFIALFWSFFCFF